MDAPEGVQAISKLINRRRFNDAVRLAARLSDDPQCADNAHFWYQYALASTLSGDTTTAAIQQARASKCSNWSKTMEVDALRDEAIGLIRAGALPIARLALDRSADLRRAHIPDDFNREAAEHMVRGRIEAAAGKPDVAYNCMVRALNIWSQYRGTADNLSLVIECYRLDPLTDQRLRDGANMQWILNTVFHLLRVTMRLSHIYRPEARILLDFFLRYDESPRRLYARLTYWTGGRLDKLMVLTGDQTY